MLVVQLRRIEVVLRDYPPAPRVQRGGMRAAGRRPQVDGQWPVGCARRGVQDQFVIAPDLSPGLCGSW
ncbi:MAG: hypothetical protein JO153_06370 [Solirubrobacterales bacterium]|nr:hypothetical protein [Solirubrobacterales bacterium]MBV9916114.1 hypothetical protein [Solirubrobacterales bacterium]